MTALSLPESSAPDLKCPRCAGEPLGVEVRGVYDGVLFWKCQACGKAWHRFEDACRRRAAQGYIDAVNA